MPVPFFRYKSGFFLFRAWADARVARIGILTTELREKKRKVHRDLLTRLSISTYYPQEMGR